MSNIVNQFRQHLLNNKKLSLISVKNYLTDIRHYLKWSAKHNFHGYTRQSFYNFANALLKEKLSNATKKRRLSALRRFGEFVKEQKITLINPAENLPENLNQPPQKNPDTNTDGEIEKVISGFKQALIDQKHSPATVKNYIADVRQFLEFIESAD